MTLRRTRSRITGIATDERGLSLLRAFGARRDGHADLTPARARKVEALYRAGFTAELRDCGEWLFRRNGRQGLRLSQAMIVAEAVL